MPSLDPAAARQFAVKVVTTLRGRGFEALWAGGCVRDQLLGKTPKDYDVATSARPEQVRDLFGHRRTHAVGAAFGVITVLGPSDAGQIEVATFRRDIHYCDGRHPEAVEFTDAREDALRRDFTINGLFFDPLKNEVLDYVGGQEDLKNRIVRAIGKAEQRFAEDKLRMLRAIRFAATLDFTLDAGTLAAIQRQALDLVIVSAERIAAEMRRMLVHSSRARAVELLREANLLEIVLPESSLLDDADWERTLAILRNLREPTFAAALAALLRGHCLGRLPAVVADRWKLANDERDGVELAYRHEAVLLEARRYAGQNGPRPLHPLQQALIEKRIDELLVYAEAVARVFQSDAADIGFCREVLNLPNELLNPPPLLTGNELKAAGFSAGPVFAKILGEVRRQQIDGLISTLDEALNLAKEIAAQQP